MPACGPPDPFVHDPGRVVIWSVLAAGSVVALGYGAFRWSAGDGGVPAFMAFSCVLIATLLVAGLVGRRYVEPLPPGPVSPAPVDPLVE